MCFGRISRETIALSLVLAAICVFAPPAHISRAAAARAWLITPQEAALGPYQGQPMMMLRGIGGPLIRIISPDEGDGTKVPVLSKPVHIKVLFEDSISTAKVIMSSLKVTYLKLWGIDITDRLKPYISGDVIDVPQADIPEGDHSIRIEIKDSAGHLASEEFHFIVK